MTPGFLCRHARPRARLQPAPLAHAACRHKSPGVILLILATLAAPSPAHALRAHRWPVASAYRIALAYWAPRGPLRCHRVVFAYSHATPVGSGAGLATAAANGGDYEVVATAPLVTEPQESCTITLGPPVREFAELSSEHTSWQWLCDTLVHEVGHLYGETDRQTNKTSIAYPIVEPGSPNFNSVPACRS